MTQKIEIIGDSLHGPYTIKIDGKVITAVDDYELFRRDGAHYVTFTILTDNFQLKRAEKEE